MNTNSVCISSTCLLYTANHVTLLITAILNSNLTRIIQPQKLLEPLTWVYGLSCASGYAAFSMSNSTVWDLNAGKVIQEARSGIDSNDVSLVRIGDVTHVFISQQARAVLRKSLWWCWCRGTIWWLL